MKCQGNLHWLLGISLENAWHSRDTFSENYLESGATVRHDVSHIYDHQDGLGSVFLMSFARSHTDRQKYLRLFMSEARW